MITKFLVKLHREPHKKDITYGPEPESRARHRWEALLQLHGYLAGDCTRSYTTDGDTATFHVWAGKFYEPKPGVQPRTRGAT